MKVGCHISIRRGYYEAARTAVHLGAKAFQYFPKNPRGLSIKSFDPKDAAKCAEYSKSNQLISIAHSPYPVNPAVDEGELRHAIIQSLRNDLKIAEACGSLGIVVHFGKYKGSEALQGYKNIIQCMNEVLAGFEGRAKLLLENQAGDGSLMGTTFEELVQVRSLSEQPERIGFCFDTCHAFACGLWPAHGGWTELVSSAEKSGWLEQLCAVHLNDSRYGRGMHKDRHANIGLGQMGEKELAPFLQYFKKRDIPIILETPVPAGATHAEEIQYVKELSQR